MKKSSRINREEHLISVPSNTKPEDLSAEEKHLVKNKKYLIQFKLDL